MIRAAFRGCFLLYSHGYLSENIMKKICKYCNEEKLLIEFKPSKFCRDGYMHMCLVCYKNKYYTQKYKYIKRNTSKIENLNCYIKKNI